jgi:hypothetical protein
MELKDGMRDVVTWDCSFLCVADKAKYLGWDIIYLQTITFLSQSVIIKHQLLKRYQTLFVLY